MPQAFIIMQIGNPELDAVCERSIVPAIEACGFDAKRVDKHNEGGLLKSEIIRFIHESDIIIADITNERPNCYLEIGYAMGYDKGRDLFLTVREDHLPGSTNYKKGGPKVHFDLAGYPIITWDPNELEAFRDELEKRIRRRHAIIKPSKGFEQKIWDDEWLLEQRLKASAGLENAGFNGGMEFRFAIEPPKLDISQRILNEAAREATMHIFGWPIAVHLGNAKREEFRPRPRTDGIFAEVVTNGKRSYDYWALKRSGDFYSLLSYFEDSRAAGKIFFNTRIHRVAEALLYCARLYNKLIDERSALIHFAVRHTGLKERILSAIGNRTISEQRRCLEAESETLVQFQTQDIEINLVDIVMKILAPMFMLFDYFELDRTIYEDIVNNFLKGKIT